jgi:hypothetical protein
VSLFKHQQDLEPSADLFPKLHYRLPTEAAHHLDMLIDENAHLLAQATLIPDSAKAPRALLEKETVFLLACLESWEAAVRTALASKTVEAMGKEALEWDALMVSCRATKSSCETSLAALRNVEMGSMSVPLFLQVS